MSKANKARTQAIIKQFKSADANHDGAISQKELGTVFGSIDPSWTSAGKLEKMFDAVDKDDDGRVDVREFIEWIFGKNMEVQKLKDEMSYDVLRLTNIGACSREDLLATMTQFGTVKHLHHVQLQTVETIVAFTTQADAVAAFTAFFEDAKEAEAAMAEAKEKDGESELRLGGSLLKTNKLLNCYAGGAGGSVFLTESACKKSGDTPVPERFAEALEAAIFNFGARVEANAGWLKRAKDMQGKAVTLKYAATMLRNLSDAINDDFILEDKEDEMDNWQKTMRIIAKGQIDVRTENNEFINSCIRELLSFCRNGGVKEDAPVFVTQDRHSMPLY